MIAIKQAKFKPPPSNEIQENQIKITNAVVNNTQAAIKSSNAVVANRQISNSSNNNKNHNDGECTKQLTLVRSTSNDQRNDSQISRNESNETRSETNNIDGATKTSAISSKLLQAHTPPSQPPPSSSSSRPSTHPPSASSPLSSSSSSVPANVAAASMEATKQALSSLPTTATLSSHPTTASLITASTRIKQRQQKFLAAAAKSATSPQYTSNQDSMTSKQVVCQRRAASASCATEPSSSNNLPGPSSRFTKMGASKRYQVSMSIINGPCCRQTFNCCQYANQQLINSSVTAGDKRDIASDCVGDSCQSLAKNHNESETNDTNRDQSQMSCKGQTYHQATSKSVDASPMTVARTKVLSMATMISGASGLQKTKGRANKGSDEVASDNRSPRENDHRRSISCASNASTVDCAELSSAPASLASVNVDEINRRVARLSCCDGDAIYNIREHQQEMRRSGENKDNDDNIDIKYNRHDNQNYHHHYYNHNYQHYQQQHQPNQFHPKYQPAHQKTQIINKSVTQPQYHQPQHIMAHYKFHNDCQSSVLTYEQVERLDSVMNQVVPIYGRGNAPTLFVKLKELIRSVRSKLQHEHSIEIRDVRLNGGAGSYVLAPENSHYNDLDLVFGTDLSDESRFDVIRDVVLDCLMEFYPDKQGLRRSDQFDIKEDPPSELSPGDANADHQTSREQQSEPIIEDDLEEASGQSLRSERSSSFESDNLNITTTELDEDSSDDEDNIIVRIDDDDARESKISTSQNADVIDTKLCENIDMTISSKQVDYKKLPANTSPDGKKCGGVGATEGKNAEQVVDSLSNPLQGVHYQSNQMPPNNCAIKEAYVHKMVKVNDDDRWSLISLGVQQSETNDYNQQQLSSSTRTTHNDARVAASGTGDSEASSCCDLSAPTYQSSNHARRQKQFPKSIELKFVDRMRRKFEFSVDSFQIILDSLIQFYDYAPQSTITIQRKSSKLQSVPAIIDPRHLSNRMICVNYDRTHKHLYHRKASDEGLICSNGENGRSVHLSNLNLGKKNQQERHQRVCETLNSTRSFYELPLEPGNSLSNSSVASSSGCSSSSSVVSSSSSSLSCDDDQDVLCYDTESAPSSCAAISENFYPTVIGRSEYGNFKEALYHLEKKLIATRSPEEIRGGGLLKYCNLLVKNYKPTNVYQIRTLERYMCSRFFIDFSDLNQQRAKLESYLANHFSDDPLQKFEYLTILYNVVHRSTVCLMNHELRLTLGMIRELAYNLNEQQAKQHQYVAQ